MSNENSIAASIAFVKQHVDDRIMGLVEILGAESGTNQKEMKAFIKEEVDTLVRFVSAQARTIDRLSRTVDQILASQGKATSTQTATAPKASRRRA